ncbi:LysM peptidoglycan-binding domain-containing protein [Streptomyces albidoflavus]|uniref:LysM peptidoglycan-binding domain-containing protein n=1 Tax=Streptomyces albidoflavus TaxID=1886 RepID=UPI0004C6214C|nr:LysM peptidoglycan-binding domain-containing protein [Streptomyces albidoflavus]
MAHRTPAPVRVLGAVLRALLGACALLALLAGVPYLLLAVGHQPAELADGTLNLLQQDDGTLFFVVLTCIGWAGWAAFTLSAALEIVALLRRRTAPAISGLRSLQSLASFLIGGIVLLAPTAAAAATGGPAVAATASHAAGDSAAAPSPASTASPQASEADRDKWPEHTVTSATELPWDLAEQYLGDGKRWKDIAALNPGLPQLAAGDQYLPVGATIKLPADADAADTGDRGQQHTFQTGTPPTPAELRTDTPAGKEKAEEPASVTVQEGDSLWTIADDHGDPQDWPALYEENRGAPLPGGGKFTDPDLIHPGQKLALPPQLTSEPPASSQEKKEKEEEKEQPPAPDDKDTTKAPEADPGTADEAPETAPDASAPGTPAPVPSGANAPTQTAPAGSSALVPAAVWTGAGALAAALVGTLATRRVLQQRRRRPGRRIPMPTGRPAATEQGLRAAQHPSGFSLLNATLRTLALNAAAAGRPLPALDAVVLHETKVDLHLAEPQAPVKPFTATSADQSVWTCSASSADLAEPEQLSETEMPYPALVSLGWTETGGHLVLIDLEHIGILNLDGNRDTARQVLQAIAVELASTPLAGHLELTALADAAPGLDSAAPERVARIADPSAALTEVAAHTADQRNALAAIGAETLRAARLLDDAAGAWTPHILLAQDLPGDATNSLLDALTAEPRTAGAVITTHAAAALPGLTWTLDCPDAEQPIVLPGSHLPVRLQGLADEHFADAIDLLTLAASDRDVPAPAWPTDAEDAETSASSPVPAASPPPADEREGDLPGEYAELEEADEPGAADSERAKAPAKEQLQPAPGEPGGPTGLTLADVLAEPSEPSVTAPLPAPPTLPGPPANAPALQPQESLGTAPTGPTVLLLGPVSVDGAAGRIDSSRRNAGTELVAFLALNPGVDHHAIDDALWPGRLVGKEMRNAVVSRTRSWLGKDTDGHLHFPRVQDAGDSRYRLGPQVSCDWTRFQHLARTGLAHHDEDGTLALGHALSLVRGRPFGGIDPTRYAWAEPAIQEMVSAIVDVAYELSTRCREASDFPGALWAARRGLLAAEESELLHRQLFLAHHAADDLEGLREAATRLARINEQLLDGADMEAETAELLRNLLPRPTARTR